MTDPAIGNGKTIAMAPWWTAFVNTILQVGAVGAICFYLLVALGAKMDHLSESVSDLNTSIRVLIEKKN